MKKTYIYLIIGLILLIGIGLGVYFYKSKNTKSSNNSDSTNSAYNSARVSTNNESNESTSNTENTNTFLENSNSQEQKNENQSSQESNSNETKNESKSQSETQPQSESKKEDVKTQIAEFNTKIYTKDSERQNNISITCSTLNNTTVNNGETFSFCNTVGKATSSKGYKEADVYKDGEVVQALGGGNCQVSTTLYNAVLKVKGLKVTERHEHSNSVPYVAKGKDAAVAYGSYDFKFVNNTGNKIKISASCDNSFVYIKIFKIS